jgi:hypothetical protein
LSSSFGTELNCTGGQCEQSVIFSNPNILTRVEVSTTLTNQDLTCVYSLSVVALNAKALRV